MICNISILVLNYYNSIIASNNFMYKNVIVSYSRIITIDNRNRDYYRQCFDRRNKNEKMYYFKFVNYVF